MKELARIERGNVTIIITKNAPKEIVSKFAETDWAQIGVDILLGIENGIENTVGSVVDKAISINSAITKERRR